MKLLKFTTQLMKALLISLPIFVSSVIAATQVDSYLSLRAETTRIVLKTTSNTPQQVTLKYSTPVRLEQILRDSLLHISTLTQDAKNIEEQHSSPSDIYWAGASLVDMSQPLDKTNIIKALDKIQAQWTDQQASSHANAIHALKHWLDTNLKNTRLHITLDFDVVLIEPSFNPIIAGEYSLILPPRPKHVLVLGATTEPQTVEWQERKSANYYLNKIEILEDADNSYVWVIQPDGVAEKHPIAYWNQNHLDIAPGAIVYLGYKSFPSISKDLNQEIVNLLKNWAL
ncbi:capsule biosynthesis GfcC family protein [Photobacterium chitinilyticum]|uniref:capsule biosynthesis GfcC family protein n=1 Tax=Photobacterium chitinilyticum TaxID=2485123 RepID=UPI003D09E4A0